MFIVLKEREKQSMSSGEEATTFPPLPETEGDFSRVFIVRRLIQLLEVKLIKVQKEPLRLDLSGVLTLRVIQHRASSNFSITVQVFQPQSGS